MIQNLEWYYFGDLVTLVANGAGACSTTINDGELVEALLKKEQQALLDILRGGKNESGEPKLFDEMRRLPSINLRSRYRWKKEPIRMDLMICNDASEVLVGPDKIILPWPFDVDTKHESKLKNRVRDEFKGECKKFDKNSFLQIDPWMLTVDELLFDKTPVGEKYRKKLIDPEEPDKRCVILEYAAKGPKRPLKFPSKFDGIVKELIPPVATFIDSRGSEMYLNVGVLGVAGVTGPEPLFEKWPCGAFEPKVGL